ncbi:MAG: sigma-70 family RNA polymerase sigma factor [Planctomycetaceae bacterium]|nr:sigma-70 family RNA polymerase sigma factor [Planctomycetaceae bacterium]
MQQWEKGCQNLRKRLEEILGKKDVPYRIIFLTRLWNCFSYHWQLAIELDSTTQVFGKVDFETVYESLLEGKGFGIRPDLGGNPLPCVHLAVAFVKKEEDAIDKFVRDYQEFAVKVVYRINQELVRQECIPDWWNLLLVKLGGFDRENQQGARFNSYVGKTFLQSWLGRVIHNYILNYLGVKSKKKNQNNGNDDVRYPVFIEILDNDRPVFDLPEREIELQEDAEKLYRVIENLDENKKLTKQQKLILNYFLKDHLPKTKIAEMLKIDRGTVTHALDAVIEKIKLHWDKIT